MWDVLKSCRRAGSLDTAIERESERPNDFRTFFDEHPKLELVAFNGQKAENAFSRHVLGDLPEELAAKLTRIRLPSTSPAHAGRSFDQKLSAWRKSLC